MPQINIYVSNRIFIQIPTDVLTPDLDAFLSKIREENTLSNPAFAEAEKRGRWTGRISPVIPLVRTEKGGISLPRGYASRVLGWAKRYGIEYTFNDCRLELPMVAFESKIELRPYQKPAVEALLKATQGNLVSPARSGKTESMLEVAARIGQPTLWLTHTKDLAKQTMLRAEERLGLSGKELGIIGSSKCKIGEKLTIGIIQSLCKMDLSELKMLFGLVIIDEVHHTGGSSTWVDVVDQLPARWKFGCTATWNRKDRLEVITERYIGPVLYTVDRSQVQKSGTVMTPRLRTINTGSISENFIKHEDRIKEWEKKCEEARLNLVKEPRPPKMDFNAIMLDLACDSDRNHLIIQTLIQECPGHFSVVMAKRVDHIETLCGMLCASEAGLRCAVIHGELPDKRRDEVLAAMNEGSLDVLFAVELTKEGLDISRLDRLFLVIGRNDENAVEQAVGRIQGVCWGKRDCMVFDFVDQEIPPVAAQFWTRKKVYLKLGMFQSGQRRQVG